MASLGVMPVTLAAAPAPLPRVTRSYPWRMEEASKTSLGSSLPRLRAQSVASFPSRGRRITASSSSSMELEIHADDPRVVSLIHSASHITDRVFRFETPVLDAVLTQFPRRQRDRRKRGVASPSASSGVKRARSSIKAHAQATDPLVVCVLSRSDCVSVYAPNGESYEVALPFHADRILALSPALGGGLLLQRRPLTSAPSAAATAAAFSPSHVKSPPGAKRHPVQPTTPPAVARPRYFTLTHPLEEVKPIALSPARSTSSSFSHRSAMFVRQQQQLKALAFVSDPALDLVSVSVITGDHQEAAGDRLNERYAGDEARRLRALMTCYHRHEKRFVVYEMTRHVYEPNSSADGQDSFSSVFSQANNATPSTPTSQVASFVSPAKARQQQREAAMMEQYFKSHIVPDYCVRLVWTSPSLDVLTESHGAGSSLTNCEAFSDSERSAPSSQRAFLISSTEEDMDGIGFSTDAAISHRLCILDEGSGMLLLKPLRASANYEDCNLFENREDDLRVVRCQSASPLRMNRDSDIDGDEYCVATDIIISSYGDGTVFLYTEGRFVAEVSLPGCGSRSDTVRLCPSVDLHNWFGVSATTKSGRAEFRRYRHPLCIERSPLLRSAAEVLRYVMTPSDYSKLHVATMELATTWYDIPRSLRCIGIGEDSEWCAFQCVMRGVVDRIVDSASEESHEHGAPKKARAARAGSTQGNDSDFVARVLSSDFALQYEHPQVSVLASLDDVSGISSSHMLGSRYHQDREGLSFALETVGRIITALHLLHEDCRLSISQGSAATSLARLLYDMCSTLGLHHLASYYSYQYRICVSVRHQTNKSTGTDRVEIPLYFEDDALVPDVYLWLRERLQGSSSSDRSNVGGGSFEQVTSTVSSPPFARLQGANDWKQALQDSDSNYPLWRTEAVCRVYEVLFPRAEDDEDMQGRSSYDASRLTELMDFLTTDKLGSRLSLDDLPLGIRIVLLEIIRVYREDPPHDTSEQVCEFIGRRDLTGIYTSALDEMHGFQGSMNSGSLVESTRLRSGAHRPRLESDVSTSAVREIADGLADVVARSQRLFPLDQRLKEVARLLRSNRPLCLRLEKTSDMSDQDFVAQQQARLLLLCKRSMALSVARGMVTMGTFDMTTVQNQAWQLSVPALPLAGRTPPTNGTVLLDVSGYAKELTHWPQFHNGCATGLRLPGKDLSSIVTRYWIKYHRPSASDFQRPNAQGSRGSGNQQSSTATARDIDEAHAAHAGVLLGLGLNGHLKSLSMADVYNYLSVSNEFVMVAVLLGMAATAARSRRKRTSSASAALQAARRRRRRGRFPTTAIDAATQDDGQLPTASQIADTDVDMEVSIPASATQDAPQEDTPSRMPVPDKEGTGAELSLERSVSKMLCIHIPALLPEALADFSVPASTQTAALMGLGILYQGTGHRLMTELLLTEITRSPASPQFVSSQNSASSTSATTSSTQFDQHEGYSLAAGLALGLVLLGRGRATTGDPGLADLGLEEKLYKYIVGGATQPFPTGGNDANSSGSYLYRGRKWKPFGTGTFSGIRPNATGSSRGGNSIKQSNDRNSWKGEHVNIGVTASGSALALAFMYMKSGNRSIASQLAVPDTLILLDYVRPDILLIRELAKNLVLWDYIEPTTTWVEKSEIPLQLREAYKLLQGGNTGATNLLPDHADVGSICESYANIVAGACFSIGLRFAGTSDSSARETLRGFVVFFRDMRSRSALLGSDIVSATTDRVTIERCLSVCAQALALVDAGTGNLETLTLLRSINLRQRVDSELTYGNHMSLSMAIGLLFLGGGRATVSRSNDAIAALVISLYPVSPMNTADNKYYLQAFRHLYTLAADTSRHIETIDTTFGEPCSVELQIETHQQSSNGTVVKASATYKTPCLLPEMDSIDRIIIKNTGFYPVDIRLQDQGDEDGDHDLWGGVRTTSGPRGVRTTANDNRVKLLLEKSIILLERRLEKPRSSLATSFTPPLSAPEAAIDSDKSSRHELMLRQYFVSDGSDSSADAQLSDDGASAWWTEKLNEKRLPVLTSSAGLLLTHMSVLYEVFSLNHPRRRLDTLTGVWSLKLFHEYHRIAPFRSIESRQTAVDSATSYSTIAGDMADGGKRDFVEWLQRRTEDALRHRWRDEGSVSLPSHSAVQHALLDPGTSKSGIMHPLFPSPASTTLTENDVVLLSALFIVFDAPPSVYNNPSDWKNRMQRAMVIASNASSASRKSLMSTVTSRSSGFAVDRFLQRHAHEDPLSKEEETFWLRVVSCFLFSV